MAAPAALPVIAKEAAGKIGLQGVLGGASSFLPPMSGGGDISAGESWPQMMLRRFWRPSQQRERRTHAREHARRLDPDLAAMRSISPAAAYRIQVGRCLERSEREWQEGFKEQVAEEAADRMGL